LLLLLPLVLISAGTSYWLANKYINQTFDKTLYRTALALADQVSLETLGAQVNLPQVAKDLLEFDEEDDVYFRIVSQSGDLINTHTDLPLPKIYPKSDKFMYYNTILNADKLRVVIYSLPISAEISPNHMNENVYVMVGETLKKRELMTSEIILSMLVPQLLILLLVSTLLFFGIKRGLLPLEKLKTNLQQRHINDLSPVNDSNVPLELRPVLSAFNDLLLRVSNTMEKQKRFVADAAHQLKTPLAGLKTQAELALRETDATKTKHALGQINQASGNLAHMVDQLLSLTKAEPEGTDYIVFEAVDLCAQAQEVCANLVADALKKDIDFGLESDLKTAVIQGNTSLLRELMNNLISNAVRYTPTGGSVTVGIKKENLNFIFLVQDNGIGILPEEQTQIFERFYRVLGTQQEGCGLGLTIVQEIAERHHASISVHSDGEGKGSLFSMEFLAS
jgi:two-component system, OmpR family, sensor histidine kinase TctE